MTSFNGSALVAALTFSVAAMVVIPILARHIPHRLQREWYREAGIAEPARTATPPPSRSPVAEYALIGGTALVLGLVLIQAYGAMSEAVAFGAYFFALLLVVTINLRHALLPDMILLPMLWAGLVFHATFGTPNDFILGAVGGYLVPYTLATIIRLAAGAQVIGYGDMKALSMAGAWFGWRALPTLFVTFVIVTIVSAVAYSVLRRGNQAQPTGLAHLFASIACVVSEMTAAG